ncbi:MAG: 50S ribosomal protein L24 [Proteobacteria bacterium]|nr:50S ribosomal protein L24 [Pseudomonadota bacterium]MDA1132249.1 50S ribosomal protein L24 [Pseudomonadota bacterium]
MATQGNKKFRIKKGDNVVVLTGRERGKSGKVLCVLRKEDRVLVQGVNMARRHTSPSQTSPGGILEKELSLHISNVSLADPKLGKPTRVGVKVLSDGRRVRFAKRSGEVVDI